MKNVEKLIFPYFHDLECRADKTIFQLKGKSIFLWLQPEFGTKFGIELVFFLLFLCV